MNKYWKFLADNACERKRTVAHTILSFSKTCPADLVAEILQRAKNIDHLPLKRKSTSSVRVFDAYCVKEDIRPAIKRFRQAAIRFDRVRGVRNLAGEAVNTLVANKMGFPSHTLLALKYTRPEKRATLIFQRLHGKTATEHITKIRPTSESDLIRIFRFLHQSLLKEIFHGDSDLGNMIFDENFENGRFVDFDCAFRLNCPVGAGLALQLAVLRPFWSGHFMPTKKYQNIARDYLDLHFPRKNEYADLFLKFYASRGRIHGWDRSRLIAANLGKPNNIPFDNTQGRL